MSLCHRALLLRCPTRRAPALKDSIEFVHRRLLSSTTTGVRPVASVTPQASISNDHGTSVDAEKDSPEVAAAKKRLDENEGIFSKHGGKMVLGFIGFLGLWFLRNHLGNKALDALKNEVEQECPVAPEEVEDLRCSNDYPPDTFRKVLDSARQAFPSGRATYPAFARHVTSSGLLPEPLALGFLLDRMALAAAAHPGFLGAAARGEAPPGGGEGSGLEVSGSGGGRWSSAETVELDVGFLLVAFSAAVNSTPTERIKQLWEFSRGMSVQGGGDAEEMAISAMSAIETVGLLMAAQQLPAGRYAVKDEKRSWPVQRYRLASGRDAFLKGLRSLHEDEEKRSKGWIQRKLAPTYDPAKEEQISFELFERLLRSGPVCAWGECLGRRGNKL